MEFPGITVCNMNKLRRSAIANSSIYNPILHLDRWKKNTVRLQHNKSDEASDGEDYDDSVLQNSVDHIYQNIDGSVYQSGGMDARMDSYWSGNYTASEVNMILFSSTKNKEVILSTTPFSLYHRLSHRYPLEQPMMIELSAWWHNCFSDIITWHVRMPLLLILEKMYCCW